MPETLTLDPDLHEYRINGRVVPSVTQIVTDVLDPDYSHCEPWHLERGRAVHKAAELIGRGKTLGTVCEAIAGQVEAVRRWYYEHPAVKVVDVEMQVCTRAYAGTLDLLCEDRKGLLLVDWKCGQHLTTCWQLGGYANALKHSHGVAVKRGRGVTLNDDGTYKETEDYELRRYGNEFLWIHGVWSIKRGMK